MRPTHLLIAALLILAALSHAEAADDALKPYCLYSEETAALADAAPAVKQALEGGGFQIAGEYAPYDGAHIIAVTHEALKAAAAQSEFGGYGAALRVALTQVGGKVQISSNNPAYLANVYRMGSDLADVAAALNKALGTPQPFGSKKGIPPAKLRKYRYMVMMPDFADANLLAEYGSQEEAVAAVESGLTQGKGGTALVYRVDVPGKAETLFGAAIREGKGADQTVMGTCDNDALKHTAHLPYEILVADGKVYAHHGKFRIALSFPDLGMGAFMKISSAPKAIERSLSEAAGAAK